MLAYRSKMPLVIKPMQNTLGRNRNMPLGKCFLLCGSESRDHWSEARLKVGDLTTKSCLYASILFQI